MDLSRLERELKKRWAYPYRWGRKQADDWDSKTTFIYTTYAFNTLLKRIETLNDALQNYALNRWYNYWSAKGVEYLFSSYATVEAHHNVYDKKVDFTIQGIPFDHKTTVFPKGFGKDYTYAIAHKKELIQWLYENQSQQGRKHLSNRLFVVLMDVKNHKHWKLKAEMPLFKTVIQEYMSTFNKQQLVQLDFGQGVVYSDILWLKKQE